MSRALRTQRPYTVWVKEKREWTLVSTFADQGKAIDKAMTFTDSGSEAIVTLEYVWWPVGTVLS